MVHNGLVNVSWVRIWIIMITGFGFPFLNLVRLKEDGLTIEKVV